MKRVLALTALAALALASPAFAQDKQTEQKTESTTEAPMPALPKMKWSFEGPFGTFDRAQLQRGFEVYTEVCSNCHSMNLLHYRDLEALGYTENEIKAIAAAKQVPDLDDKGEPTQRAARPYDAFAAPFPNEKAARAANNGALPPDLSLIAKSREGGPDYIHAIMVGFHDAPSGTTMMPGMNYNDYFNGHQIAMPPPLQDGTVNYGDGTKATTDQEAQDVAAFLTWASEPVQEERKRTGAKVMIFLLIMAGVLYGAKRRVWAKLH